MVGWPRRARSVALPRGRQPCLQRVTQYTALAAQNRTSGVGAAERPAGRVFTARAARTRAGGSRAVAGAYRQAAAAAAQRPGLRRDRSGARGSAGLGRDTARAR